ncbi:MAG: UDP-N-acetylglucosamine--N-acetylmuramyl-(pentapeptide) pyrophosphoryl-undecaprenol N-acetylglucosamine transferase [Bifidobacteriaceae bacterium]|jgi:undecaprenyldiphospho-muramoylpentapeptide beta-N-acetylglucosaminyltransferase|nr:UDP-N-acetylglucosamine--N-acetylmuramyl-(pentapeptide) pyrophosphoryl-undecaprenol N-acetylglucosamine transferase [Bifidobacteriaceae bacterium]
MRLILAGGGTFGHVGPLLATAKELRRRDLDAQLRAVGTAEGLEAELVPAAGLELVIIPKVPLPRRPGGYAVRFPGLWMRAVASLRDLLAEFEPDAVVGFGGYVATPVYRVAAKAGLPIIVHEANARPGLANRWGAARAAAVGVAFARTELPGAKLVGMPLRSELARLDRDVSRPRARESLGLEPDRPTLLVSGGSLGAANLNQAIVAVAGPLLAAGAQVLHLTGRGKAAPVARAVRGIDGAERFHVLEYLEEMEMALAAADLAVQRAGAGAVSELACVGLPSVLVPLPVGNGEQRLNAVDLVEAGGAVLVQDGDFADWAAKNLVDLLTNPERLALMAEAARSVGIPDGAERLADMIEQAVPGA